MSRLYYFQLFQVCQLIAIALMVSSCDPSRPEMVIQETQTTPSSTSSPILQPIATEFPPQTTDILQPAPTQTEFALPCLQDLCVFRSHFVFQTPIDSAHNQKVEPSYPYGSTQNGSRETHHGVEFINASGTPVLAAGAGKVIYAGNDLTTQVGWWVNYYGNLVVIQHSINGFDAPIFTLYGHLSKIIAHIGDNVSAGTIIGEVGMSGKALGSHLHFEVREEINDYAHTRNPELWLIPAEDSGVLVGQIFNETGTVRRYPDFKLISLDHPDLNLPRPVPYADSGVNPDDQYQEVFAYPNLPHGKYEIRFSPNGKTDVVQFEIFSGLITRITFHTKY